jgi:hypothetical protein
MSRNTLQTLFLIIVSLLLAVALFIAGAIWRGRVTTRSVVTNSSKSVAADEARRIGQHTVITPGTKYVTVFSSPRIVRALRESSSSPSESCAA